MDVRWLDANHNGHPSLGLGFRLERADPSWCEQLSREVDAAPQLPLEEQIY